MDIVTLPPYSLRREIIKVLELLNKSGNGSVVSPAGIVAFLNHVGPPLNEEDMFVVEALLETLWRDGLVGKSEAPDPNHLDGYCIREAAETAAARGIFIKLNPLDERFRTVKPKIEMIPGSTGRNCSTSAETQYRPPLPPDGNAHPGASTFTPGGDRYAEGSRQTAQRFRGQARRVL